MDDPYAMPPFGLKFPESVDPMAHANGAKGMSRFALAKHFAF
jgi:hypothetical protein